MKSNRRTFISGLGAAVTLAPGFSLRAGSASNAALTQVDHKFLPSPKQVHDWHAAKDSKGGPTLAGSPSWHNYLDLLEKELRAAGVVDIFRNPIPYTRWHTTEFPRYCHLVLQHRIFPTSMLTACLAHTCITSRAGLYMAPAHRYESSFVTIIYTRSFLQTTCK